MARPRMVLKSVVFAARPPNALPFVTVADVKA
jgi:hypothetical protein